MVSYVDVTDATAQKEILERSDEVTVVVDLWAPWCGPCRTLGPIIEKVIAETEGEVVLAKVNVDENPQLGQMFKVQSIPAVHAVKAKQVVGSFTGAQGEDYVRSFVNQFVPTDEERRLDALLAEGTEDSLLAALEIKPDHEGAIVALAERYVAENRTDEALALLRRIPETGEVRRVAALARTASSDGESADGAAADLDVKLEDLLSRVHEDDDARQEFLDHLEVMGPDDPRTTEWRKRLTRALF